MQTLWLLPAGHAGIYEDNYPTHHPVSYYWQLVAPAMNQLVKKSKMSCTLMVPE